MGNIETAEQASSPRVRIAMSDGAIVDHFFRLGYHVKYDDLFFTTEQIDDFRAARRDWLRAGKVIRDEGGLLVLRDAQPSAGQPTRDIVIVSLGYARAIMGVFSKRDRPPYYRFALRMD